MSFGSDNSVVDTANSFALITQGLTMEGLDQLLYLQGVGAEYTNYQGEQVFFSEKNRRAILKRLWLSAYIDRERNSTS